MTMVIVVVMEMVIVIVMVMVTGSWHAFEVDRARAWYSFFGNKPNIVIKGILVIIITINYANKNGSRSQMDG